MQNYWYAARPNEIFLDLDNKRAVSRALNVLAIATEKRELSVKQIWMFASGTVGHVHIIIVLRRRLDPIERMAWSLWMANDRLRVAFVLERWLLCVPNADLLVGKIRYHRKANDICVCEGKHKDKTVTGNCPAMERLIGKDAATADYFTRTGKVGYKPVEPLLVPWGRLSLASIQRWAHGDSNAKRLLQNK